MGEHFFVVKNIIFRDLLPVMLTRMLLRSDNLLLTVICKLILLLKQKISVKSIKNNEKLVFLCTILKCLFPCILACLFRIYRYWSKIKSFCKLDTIYLSIQISKFKHFVDKLKFRPIANQMEVELDVISSDSIQRMTFPSHNRLYI